MVEFVKFAENRSLEEAEIIYQQRIEDAKSIHLRHSHNFVKRDCPTCGSSDYKNADDFYNRYKVAKCNVCTSLFVNPAPHYEALNEYYMEAKCNKVWDELSKKRNKKKKNFIMDDRVKITLDYIDKIKSKEKEVKILEVGCGSGVFLAKLKQALADKSIESSVSLAGIDIDEILVSKSVDNDLNLYHSSIEDFAKKQNEEYDIVLHFELIEHLLEPSTFMKDLHKLLRTDGYVISTTQNVDGLAYAASHYNSIKLLAHSIYPPLHLNAFNIAQMTYLAIRSGFKIEKIYTPGKLDVDIVAIMKDELTDEKLKLVSALDDQNKGLLQYVVSLVNGSTHMVCIIKK